MTMPDVPHTGPKFEAMMSEIDRKLSIDGKAIPSRPLLAAMEVSLKYGVDIPLGGAGDRLPHDLQKYTPLSDAIRNWYDETYGNRLKEDPCSGRTVLELDRDLYVLRIPRIFGGEPRWVISRTFLDLP